MYIRTIIVDCKIVYPEIRIEIKSTIKRKREIESTQLIEKSNGSLTRMLFF